MQPPFKPGDKVFRFTEYNYDEEGRDPDEDDVPMEMGGTYTVAECIVRRYNPDGTPSKFTVYFEELDRKFYAEDFEKCVKISHLPKWFSNN